MESFMSCNQCSLQLWKHSICVGICWITNLVMASNSFKSLFIFLRPIYFSIESAGRDELGAAVLDDYVWLLLGSLSVRSCHQQNRRFSGLICLLHVSFSIEKKKMNCPVKGSIKGGTEPVVLLPAGSDNKDRSRTRLSSTAITQSSRIEACNSTLCSTCNRTVDRMASALPISSLYGTGTSPVQNRWIYQLLWPYWGTTEGCKEQCMLLHHLLGPSHCVIACTRSL